MLFNGVSILTQGESLGIWTLPSLSRGFEVLLIPSCCVIHGLVSAAGAKGTPGKASILGIALPGTVTGTAAATGNGFSEADHPQDSSGTPRWL